MKRAGISQVFRMKSILLLSLLLMTAFACMPRKNSTNGSTVKASGDSWSLNEMSELTYQAIKSACDDPMGAQDLGISREECYLLMAGSSVRESSWNANKSCEAWGNAGDPCCGLTQSRRSDARAVSLSCDPHAHSSEGYKCNILTGLRNIGCKASGGKDCQAFGSDGSIHTGVKKHLGGNTGALSSYIQDMKAVYERQDIRSKFGINGNTRDWNAAFYNTRSSQAPVQGNRQVQVQRTGGDQSGCTYENAYKYNGWGYNKSKAESCPPEGNRGNSNGGASDGCTYEDAHKHNGWGYNNAKGESCPPR